MSRARLVRLALSLCAVAGLVVAATPAQGQQTVYVAFGDSITDGVGDELDAGGYPARLQALLRDAGQDALVINQGLGGEQTEEAFDRINNVLNQGGDVFLLMEGSNDISRDVDVETIRFNLAELARRAENAGFRVIHATTIPRIPRARRDNDNLLNRKLNRNIRDLAGINPSRDLVDNFEILDDIDNVFGRFYSPSPTDFVGHLNAAGYDIMAQAFFDVIQGNDTVGPVLGLVSPANEARQVGRNEALKVDIWDFGSGIDTASVVLTVEGEEVTPSVAGGRRLLSLTYQPPTPWNGTTVVDFSARDLATPANENAERVTRFFPQGTTFLDGDIDRDGRVDGADLVDFGARFGATRGTDRYNQRADINDDEVIDGLDLIELAANFGQSNF